MVADSPRSPRRAVRAPRTTGARPGAYSSIGGGVAPRIGGATGSGGAVTTTTTRPPILLELSPTYVRAGFVGQLAVAPRITMCCHVSPPHPQASASDWYRYYSPILQDATSYVLEGSSAVAAAHHHTQASAAAATSTAAPSSASPSTDHGRRVMIVHHGMPHMAKNQLHALRRLLLGEYRLPALSVQPAMKMAFYAATTTTTTTSSGAVASIPLEHGMAVYVHGGEAHCVAISHSQCLDYTYQATGRTTSLDAHPHNGPTTLQQNWEQVWKSHLLNEESPHNVALCIVKCLEACSRDDRRQVASHLVFCGDWFVSEPRKVQTFVIQQVRKILTPVKAASKRGPVRTAADDETLSVAEGGDDPSSPEQQPDTTSEPQQESYTHRAVSSDLRTQRLADSVGMAGDRSRNVAIPSTVLPWVGAHIWAKHWHSVHPDSPAFQWETKHK